MPEDNSEKNDSKDQIIKVKEKVKDYVKVLDVIEKDIDDVYNYADYHKKLIYEDRKRSSRMTNILEEFENYNIYPAQIMNDLSSSVSGAIDEISHVQSVWNNAKQKMYGVTGFMSASNLNMASGEEFINLYLEDHKDLDPILKIYKTYPVERNKFEKIEDLQRRLTLSHENLAQRLNEISNNIFNQNSFSSLISIGNLIAGFIKDFLKTMAPDEMVIKAFQSKSPFFRCLFTIIGFDLNYDKTKMEYNSFRDLSQRYVDIMHDSDRIKHEEYTEDLSKLRYKVNKNIQEMINYTNRILDLREINYKEE